MCAGLLTFETGDDDVAFAEVSALNSASEGSVKGPAPPASASSLESVGDFGPFDFLGWLKRNTFYVVGSVLACR